MNDIIRYADGLVGCHRRMVRRLALMVALFLLLDLALFMSRSPLIGWAMGLTFLAVVGNLGVFFGSIGRGVGCPGCKSGRGMAPVRRKDILWLRCKGCGNVFETDCEFGYAGAAPARRTDIEPRAGIPDR